MKFWRAIKYVFSILFRSRKKSLHSLDDWENPPFFKRIWDKTAGFFYNWWELKLEKYKIWRWKKSKDAEEEKIVLEVVQKSRKRLISFILVFLALWALDLIIQMVFSSTLSELLPMGYTMFVQSFLGVMIGTLSVFIALIFSLYGIVVQVVMQKHSTAVTRYINEDKFPNFFLRGLVFIDLLAIFLYLRGELFPEIPILISLVFLVFAIVYAIISLIIFKDSYTYSIKPDNLFIRLGAEINDQIRIATGDDKAVRNSRSVIHHSGERARELFDVLESLFDDLLREGNFKDISKAPTTLAFIFVEYLEKRKFIEDEKGWWFPRQLKMVKGDSMSTYAIKASYEIQGRGVLHMPVRNKEWFEQRAKELLDIMTRNIPVVNEDAYTRAILLAYNIILAGRHTKNEYDQYDSKIRGAYENGEVEIFKWFYEEFSRLPQVLNFNSENVSFEFLNMLFAIGLVLLEENDEVLNTIEEFLERIVSDGQISATLGDLKDLNLPKNAHDLLCELLKGLEAEVTCEGSVVTPMVSFTQEIFDKLKNKYLKDADELLTQIFTDVDNLIGKLLDEKNFGMCVRLVELEIRWFQKLIYLEKFELAIKHSKVLNNAYKTIVKIPVNETQKVELLEALELLIFPVAIANKKELFSPLSSLLIFLLQYVYKPQQATEEQLLLMRTLVVLGGFLYLVGEFEEDFSLLETYAGELRVIYPNIVTGLEALEKLKSVRISGMILSGRIISREATRYHHWFSTMYRKIDDLPKALYQTRIYAGMSEAANHPSDFIKEMSVGIRFNEDECIEGFIKWLKIKYQPEIESDVKEDVEKSKIDAESLVKKSQNNDKEYVEGHVKEVKEKPIDDDDNNDEPEYVNPKKNA